MENCCIGKARILGCFPATSCATEEAANRAATFLATEGIIAEWSIPASAAYPRKAANRVCNDRSATKDSHGWIVVTGHFTSNKQDASEAFFFDVDSYGMMQ